MPGGIHLVVAVLLSQVSREEGTHIFLKSGNRMVSVREYRKVLTLSVRQDDWVEILVDGGQEEESVMEQMEKILCSR